MKYGTGPEIQYILYDVGEYLCQLMVMERSDPLARRRFLQLSATGGVVAVAGCAGGRDDSDSGSSENGDGGFPTTDVRMDIRNTAETQATNPIYANYNTPHSHETLTHDPEETYNIHREVFKTLEEVDPTLGQFIPSLRDDEKEADAKETGILMVDGYERFSEENWLNADPQDSVRLAIRYLQSLDQKHMRNHPSRRAEYVTAITQAFEQEHPEVDIHAWGLNGDGGQLQAGMVYIENNDTLYLLEHTLSGLDDWDDEEQLDYVIPKIENSEYFRDDQASERFTHHPLRFGEDERERTQGISNFEDAKGYASSTLHRINVPTVVSHNTSEVNVIENDPNESFAFTTGFLSDVMENLRFYNDSSYDNADFDTIRAQSALAYELTQHEDDFVLGGDVESPWVLRVQDDNLLDEIWADEKGEYDNLINEMEEYEDSIDIVAEDYDEMDDALEQAYQLDNLEEVDALNG